MASSQNGYSANDRSVIQTYPIGSTKKVSLRKGSTGALLAHMANWFDGHVRDIDPGQLDEWGYAERVIRGGTQLSNHASGTAVDVDATKWPLGSDASKYLTGAEIARVHQQLLVYEGCIRWGQDYTGRKDPMHFEIDKGQAVCDRVWAKISGGGGSAPTPVTNPVSAVQTALHFVGNEIDGVWGGQTDAGLNTVRGAINGNFNLPGGVKEAQTRVGAVADGDWGPASKRALTATIANLQNIWNDPPANGTWRDSTQRAYERDRKAYFQG